MMMNLPKSLNNADRLSTPPSPVDSPTVPAADATSNIIRMNFWFSKYDSIMVKPVTSPNARAESTNALWTISWGIRRWNIMTSAPPPPPPPHPPPQIPQGGGLFPPPPPPPPLGGGWWGGRRPKPRSAQLTSHHLPPPPVVFFFFNNPPPPPPPPSPPPPPLSRGKGPLFGGAPRGDARK